MNDSSTSDVSTSQRRSSLRSSSNSNTDRVISPATQRSSIRSSLKSLTINTQTLGADQRRSSSLVDELGQSQRSTAASAATITRGMIRSVRENEITNEHNGVLNTSTTSAATEDMDTHEHPNDRSHTGQMKKKVIKRKGFVGKSQLIDEFFQRSDAGGLLCKLCRATSQETKVHQNIVNSDANLRSHLARKHRRTDLLYPSQKRQYKKKDQRLSPDVKKKLDQALIYAVIKDSRGFGDFRKPGFQHFLKVAFPGLLYKGPHRSTIRRYLQMWYRSHRNELKKKFESISDISLTTDTWTNNRRTHFICVTAHFFENFEYKSMVISFRRFCGRTFAYRIRIFLRNELRKLNISSKIRSITTDNGGDVKLATNTNEFGFRISCLAHNLNLTVVNGLGIWEKETTKESASTSATNENVENLTLVHDDDIEDDRSELTEDSASNKDDSASEDPSDSEEEEDDDEEDDGDENDPGDHNENDPDGGGEGRRISSRSKVSIGEIDQGYFNEHQMSITNPKQLTLKLMKRTRSLVSTVHHSSILDAHVREQMQSKSNDSNQNQAGTDEQKSAKGELIIDFRIRWNSTYLMINRFINIRHIVNEITHTPTQVVGLRTEQERKLTDLSFNHFEWNWLIALEHVLQPFENATRILSGRDYQTLSIKQLVLNGLKSFLTTHKVGETMVNTLKKLLLVQYHDYCENSMSKEERVAMMIASFLDPSTYYYVCEDEEFLNEAKRLIISKHHQLNSYPSESSSSISLSSDLSLATITTTTTMTTSMTSIGSFLRKCEYSTTSKALPIAQTATLTIQQEIGSYISSIDGTTDFHMFWKNNQHKLPGLAFLVRRFCIMPVTSVASESAFSVAGYVQRKQRSSLAPSTLRYSMLLRDSDLLSEMAIEREKI